MRQFFIILVLLIWILLGWCYYQNTLSCCAVTETVEAVEEKPIVAAAVEKSRPLLYAWSANKSIYGDGWNAYRDSIAQGHNENNRLQITGYYRSDEVNNTTFENLGLARADDVSKQFAGKIDPANISLLGKLTDELDGQRTTRFESADFRYLVNSANVKEVDDKALIYFPYNSTRKRNAADVESYLDDVAERVKKSGESVRLVGHTDSLGDNVSNQRLGLMRANVIKEYLVSKGVSASKIATSSKGEIQPIDNNNTNAGRAKNRRTELFIN